LGFFLGDFLLLKSSRGVDYALNLILGFGEISGFFWETTAYTKASLYTPAARRERWGI
jgi:hypothetical protein